MAGMVRSKHQLDKGEMRRAHEVDAHGLGPNQHHLHGTSHSGHGKHGHSQAAPADHEASGPGDSPAHLPTPAGAAHAPGLPEAAGDHTGHTQAGPIAQPEGGAGSNNGLTELLGHLPSGGEGAPIFVVPVDHLQINNNAFISNTQVENTNIVFNADHGASVDVEGDVNAISFQGAQIEVNSFHMSGGGHGLAEDLGWGDAAWGEAGGFDAVLIGHLDDGAAPGCGHHSPIIIMPIEHLEINNNTFIQNTQIENTNIVFNADHGGDIDIDGDVNAISTQHAAIESGAAHQQLV